MTGPEMRGSGPDRRTPERSRAVVAAELADVERYLREVPPHQSGGRDVLERRRAALQRELAALSAGTRTDT